jgi:fibro-slime domain-containing protein
VKPFLVALSIVLLAACGPSGGSGDDDDGSSVDGGGGGDDGGDDQPVGDCNKLPVTIRDFQFGNPEDFENPDGNSDFASPGLVENDLGADGTPVYAPSGPVFPHTSGAANFALWYHDSAGVNQAIPYTLQLTTNSSGVTGFDSSAFFPIDGMGFGNEGLDVNGVEHNFSFTTEVHTSFVYHGGEHFTFTGDDDLWLFINGKLAIDLGGLHPSLAATVDLDAKAGELGITPGGHYRMDIFHAERHTDASNFHIETTINCFQVPG